MKYFLFLFIIISYTITAEAQLITADNRGAGIMSEHYLFKKPQGRYISMYSSILWNMYELNNSGISFYNHSGNMLYGIQSVFSGNDIVCRLSVNPMISYYTANALFGIMPAFKYRYFADRVMSCAYDVFLFCAVFPGSFHSTAVFRLGEYTESALITSYTSEHFYITIQCIYNGFMTLGGEILFALNSCMNVAFYADMNRILKTGITLNYSIYSLEYSAYIHPMLGIGHMCTLGLHIPYYNKHADIDIPQYERANDIIQIPYHSIININKANIHQLMDIDGIGSKMALKILTKRLIINGYKSYEQIDSIKGIGESLMENIKNSTFLGE